MVRRTVDRLDPDQLPRQEAKCRERSLRAIAAHDNAVISGGQACDLQLVLALIAPEPWLTVIRLCISGKPSRHAAGVIGGILHGFKPQRSAEPWTGKQCAVPD